MGRTFGVGHSAFRCGRHIPPVYSRGFLLRPPLPLCVACSMSHALSLASAKFTTANFTAAKLTRQQPPPPKGCIRGGGGGGTPPSTRRAPSLCPATVSLTASAGFSGICNRQ